MGAVESTPAPPPEYCLVPPVIRAARKRTIPIDFESFPKVGAAARELLYDDYGDRVRVQLFVHPEQDLEFQANFGLRQDKQLQGETSVRYDKGNLSIEGGLNTKTAGQVDVKALYKLKGDAAVFASYNRELGILNPTQSNVLQAGFLHNSSKSALSLKTSVNMDKVRSTQTLDEVHGELSGVINLAPRVSAQVNAIAKTKLSDVSSTTLEDLQFTLGYHSPGTVSDAQPKFETALSVSNFGKRLNLTYYQHLVSRRRIYNPFEEKNVKQIVNYLDLGMEVELQNDNGKTENRLDVGVGWQTSKNLAFKGKVGSSGVFGVLKCKTWGSPKVCASISAGVDWDSNPRYGVSLSLEDINLQPIYEQPPPDLKLSTPYGQVNAVPVERATERVYIGVQEPSPSR
eukprot:TRINITY_DN15801_c0_g1_i1.p1 TRINITY_DN15801_c0_g1~~TRINITY_DN15801_c0_g1_i1.p1  ORF type:complete len:429 (-),score=89.73 TRINITY_DN15801_c0_g1_i1:46-1245(-)